MPNFSSQLRTLIAHSSKADAGIAVSEDGRLIGVNEDGVEFDLENAVSSSAAFGVLQSSLRTQPGSTDGEVRYLKGHTTAGDGGEGTFRWSTVAAIDDGGTVLNAGGLGSSSAGWRRVFFGHFNVKWFGAKGDGVTNDRPAIQLAIDTAIDAGLGVAKKSGTLFFPPGTYLLDDGLPLIIAKKNGSDYQFVSCSFLGDADPFDVLSTGTISGAVIKQNDPAQACVIVQAGRTCVFEKIVFWGRNNWTDTISAADPVNFYDSTWNTTHAAVSDAPFVLAGCRDNRYSPHAAIVVDPFHRAQDDGVPPTGKFPDVTDRYPGLDSWYTNSGQGGGSSEINFRRCWAQHFVVGFGLGMNGQSKNVEACVFEECKALGVKCAIAIGQNQSRNITILAGIFGQGDAAIDCQSYGEGVGCSPTVHGAQFGGRMVIRCSTSGVDGAFYGSYSGEGIMMLGHFPGDRCTFDTCPFGFMATPVGYPAYPKVFCDSNSRPVIRSCKFYDTDVTAETRYFIDGDFQGDTRFPQSLNNVGRRMHIIGNQANNVHFERVRSEDGDFYENREGAAIVRRDYESDFFSMSAPRGGAFFTTEYDAFPRIQWIDAQTGFLEPGNTDVEVFNDGTAELTAASGLAAIYSVGDIVEELASLTGVIDGLPGTPVAACLGKVKTVSDTSVILEHVPTYVFDAYSGLGPQTRYLLVFTPRRCHALTTGTLNTLTQITAASPATYWHDGERIRDEDGYIGDNYILSKAGTTFNLGKSAPSAPGLGVTLYLYDQPRWDIQKSFYTSQSPPFTQGGWWNIGSAVDPRIPLDNVWQCWTQRAAQGAMALAGSSDKSSANGAWVGIAGFGSTHATYPSTPVIMFGGKSTCRLNFVKADADGANQAVVAQMTRSGSMLLDGDVVIDRSGTQVTWTHSAGSPEGAVTANKGSLCSDTTNGELYIKNTGTGNTGWKLVTHA